MNLLQLMIDGMILSFCIILHAANIQTITEDVNEIDTKSLTVNLNYIPSFTKFPWAPIVLNETYYQFYSSLAQFEVNTNLNDGTSVIFDILQDKDFTANIQNTFILEQVNNTAHIIIGGKLDYELVQEYRITIRAMNLRGLKADATMLVKVLDENDNVPEIIGDSNGVILEHEPVGTFVMQVKAHDNDGTTAENSIEKYHKTFSPFS